VRAERAPPTAVIRRELDAALPGGTSATKDRSPWFRTSSYRAASEAIVPLVEPLDEEHLGIGFDADVGQEYLAAMPSVTVAGFGIRRSSTAAAPIKRIPINEQDRDSRRLHGPSRPLSGEPATAYPPMPPRIAAIVAAKRKYDALTNDELPLTPSAALPRAPAGFFRPRSPYRSP